MPTIITASDLRDVLGVSDSLYSDVYLEQIIETAEGAIIPLLKAAPTGTDYADVPVIYSTILNASIDVFQARIAPGGVQEGVDFTPSPFKFGRSFFSRYTGLLGDWVDVESMVG